MKIKLKDKKVPNQVKLTMSIKEYETLKDYMGKLSFENTKDIYKWTSKSEKELSKIHNFTSILYTTLNELKL